MSGGKPPIQIEGYRSPISAIHCFMLTPAVFFSIACPRVKKIQAQADGIDYPIINFRWRL
eukprot:scaffold615686_cov41-Prasinocladus_malaysianus.AAC.1